MQLQATAVSDLFVRGSVVWGRKQGHKKIKLLLHPRDQHSHSLMKLVQVNFVQMQLESLKIATRRPISSLQFARKRLRGPEMNCGRALAASTLQSLWKTILAASHSLTQDEAPDSELLSSVHPSLRLGHLALE